MTVYLDIILIYNFLIDWLLLWTVAYILKLRPKPIRIVLGACVGASYTMVLFLPAIPGLYTFFSKLMLSMCMILTVFGFHRLYVFLHRLLVFYLVAFLLGGGLIGIHYFLQSESEVWSGIVVTQSSGAASPMTWGFIAICFPFVLWLSKKGLKQMKDSGRKAALYAVARVTINDETIVCKGLIDTGNQLHEPITRIPVMIIDLARLKEHLPALLYETVMREEPFSASSMFAQLEDHWLQRLRLIPYRGVAKGMDLLVAIRPDRIKIETNEGDYETTRVLIGLNPNRLSSDGSYEAIIHPSLINDEFLVRERDPLSRENAMTI